MKRKIFLILIVLIFVLTACTKNDEADTTGPISRVQVEDSGFDLSPMINLINQGDTVSDLDEVLLTYLDNYSYIYEPYEVTFDAAIANTSTDNDDASTQMVQIVIEAYSEYANTFNEDIFSNLELMFLQIRQDIEANIHYDTVLTMFVKNNDGEEHYRFRFEFDYASMTDSLEREIRIIDDLANNTTVVSDFLDDYILNEENHYAMTFFLLRYDELQFTSITIYQYQKVFNLGGVGTFGNNTEIYTLVQNKLPDYKQES